MQAFVSQVLSNNTQMMTLKDFTASIVCTWFTWPKLFCHSRWLVKNGHPWFLHQLLFQRLLYQVWSLILQAKQPLQCLLKLYTMKWETRSMLWAGIVEVSIHLPILMIDRPKLQQSQQSVACLKTLGIKVWLLEVLVTRCKDGNLVFWLHLYLEKSWYP